MAEQRETTTERLVDAINVVLFARQTGVLAIKRGYGNMQEEGTITFVNGQIVRVAVSQLQGVEALNWLSTWGLCRINFTPTTFLEASSTYLLPAGPSTDPSLTTPPTQFSPQTNRHNNGQNEQNVHSDFPVPLGIPYRLQEGREALQHLERMNLSRTHRRLFLLADGRRTAGDLAHLMSKPVEEVYRLLADLERVGLIQH